MVVAPSKDRQQLRAPRVLIVDDEVALCHSWERILACSGFTVRSVHHGDEVFAAIRSFHPDVIILDARLPGADGVTLCRLLRHQSAFADLKVLLCSGHLDVNVDEAQALADGFARKPLHPDQLLAILAELSAHPQHA